MRSLFSSARHCPSKNQYPGQWKGEGRKVVVKVIIYIYNSNANNRRTCTCTTSEHPLFKGRIFVFLILKEKLYQRKYWVRSLIEVIRNIHDEWLCSSLPQFTHFAHVHVHVLVLGIYLRLFLYKPPPINFNFSEISRKPVKRLVLLFAVLDSPPDSPWILTYHASLWLRPEVRTRGKKIKRSRLLFSNT